MRAGDIIYEKREGRALDPKAIEWLVDEYVRDRVPDYQMAAFLMAVFFRGLDETELAALVGAMMRSGQTWDWTKIDGPKVDKHSTGGVGDKVSLMLAPIAAACGLVVPMVAGRGLGHTGGTIDKLEAIPGFRTDLDRARIGRLLRRVGAVIVTQSERFVPADKRLYALRDVTATVESIPLIAASIMSKKLAEGCEALALDIKVGNGAFMTDRRSARRLAQTMIGIGRQMGRRVGAVLTDMNQPLGRAVGNANEVIEAIECLGGQWPDDLRRVTFALTERMLILGDLARDARSARKMIKKALDSGVALEKFRAMIEGQGGDPRVIDDPRRLPSAPREAVVTAPHAGYLAEMNTRQIGIAAAVLGAGRATKEDTIDPGVGLWVEAKLGDRVERGQPVFTVRYRKARAWANAEPLFQNAFNLKKEKIHPPRIILGRLDDKQ